MKPRAGWTMPCPQARCRLRPCGISFLPTTNYFDSLDRAAEALATAGPSPRRGALPEWLTQHLRHQHGVFVLRSEAGDAPLRRFDAASRTLHLSADLQPSQHFGVGECLEALALLNQGLSQF